MYHQWLIFATLVANAPPATTPPPPTYISDRLTVSLHGANAADAPIVKQILGGAPVKVLSHDGALLKIRTEDGSVGWIESALVTTDTPTHVLYLELSERYSKVQQDKPGATATNRDESKIVTDLRAEIKTALEFAVELERHIRNTSTQTYEAIGRIRVLEAENSALKDELAVKSSASSATTAVATPRDAGNALPAGTAPVVKKFAVTLPWFIGSLVLVLMLGGVISWIVMRRRIRKASAD
jgi:SH3 domain protein